MGMSLPIPLVVRTLKLISLGGYIIKLLATSRAYKSLGLLWHIFNDIYCPEARKALYVYFNHQIYLIILFVLVETLPIVHV